MFCGVRAATAGRPYASQHPLNGIAIPSPWGGLGKGLVRGKKKAPRNRGAHIE